METRHLTCIVCPLGCNLVVDIDGEEVSVSGNTCNRGVDYAKKEIFFPTRVLTSSIAVECGNFSMVSVKTQSDIPKDKLFEVMKELKKVTLQAPVFIGDVIIKNCCGLDVDIVATRDVIRV